MLSPLIQKLHDDYAYPCIDEENLDSFLAEHEQVLLFFSEDPQQFPESNDVAVVLPELMKVYADRLVVGVVSLSSQRRLQTRFGFSTWPSLVFLRNAQYLGVISQIQNWDDYLMQFERILSAPTPHIPVFKIPVVSDNSSNTCHGH